MKRLDIVSNQEKVNQKQNGQSLQLAHYCQKTVTTVGTSEEKGGSCTLFQRMEISEVIIKVSFPIFSGLVNDFLYSWRR